jgi:hypothetical protein
MLTADPIGLQVLSSLCLTGRNRLLSLHPSPPNLHLQYQSFGVCNNCITSHGTKCNRMVQYFSRLPFYLWVSTWVRRWVTFFWVWHATNLIQDTIWRHFGNTLHWYQALFATANYKVDMWIWNVLSTQTAPLANPPTASSTEGARREKKHWPHRVTVEDVKDEDDTIEPHSPSTHPVKDTNNIPPLPFLLLKDFPCMNEQTPHDLSPSIYLQKQCPLCFLETSPTYRLPHISQEL